VYVYPSILQLQELAHRTDLSWFTGKMGTLRMVSATNAPNTQKHKQQLTGIERLN